MKILMAALLRLIQAAFIAWVVFWSSPLFAGEAQYAYDDLGRLMIVVDESGNTPIYNYDAVGNLVSIDRFTPGGTGIGIYALLPSKGAIGSQVKIQGYGFSTTPANNTVTFSGTTTYTWDARNRLIAINGPEITASFTYDALNRRISKTVNGGTTGYWYDGTDILAELNGSTPTATYLRGLAIDEPFIRKGASDEFYQTDALGSTLVLTDAAGAPQTTYTYEPFGKTTAAGTSSNPFQYTGREQDGIGLYYYRNRNYSPTTQRFVSEDLLELFSGDINAYVYAANAPPNFTDPDGLAIVAPGLPPPGCEPLSGRKEFLGRFFNRLTCAAHFVPGAGVLGSAARAGLTAQQASNLARFAKNLPRNAGAVKTFDLPNGGKAFQADVAAKNIPGGFARYEKQVDAAGNTLNFSKTTYRPDGTILPGASRTYFQR